MTSRHRCAGPSASVDGVSSDLAICDSMTSGTSMSSTDKAVHGALSHAVRAPLEVKVRLGA